MKKQHILLLLFAALPLIARHQHLAMNFGTVFNYARYTLGCLEPQSGYLVGPHFDFSYQKSYRPFFGLEFDGRWNAGFISDKNSTTRADVADYIPATYLGFTFDTADHAFRITPFTGLGYYRLSYQLEPDMLTYQYNQIFVPVGLNFNYHFERNFSIGLDTMYRVGAYNHLKLKTPCITPDDCTDECNGNSLKLNYSSGFRVRMPFVCHYRNGKKVAFNTTLAPFFDWNKFASTCDANSQGIVFPIPTNTRWYLGVMANLGISF
jgi:hypothetical protein